MMNRILFALVGFFACASASAETVSVNAIDRVLETIEAATKHRNTALAGYNLKQGSPIVLNLAQFNDSELAAEFTLKMAADFLRASSNPDKQLARDFFASARSVCQLSVDRMDYISYETRQQAVVDQMEAQIENIRSACDLLAKAYP